ncbi:ABC transporter substrate-binding protein [Aquabacter sp. CN5-332]|uniref:ABC transporter substrate-binding protein n=1 Tax=Aquabacter sp. CN5-332 TaxID=3156608 RepID=UPI0032B381A7
MRSILAASLKTFTLLIAAVAMLASGLTAEAAEIVSGLSSRSFNPGFSNAWIGGPLGLYGNLSIEAVGTQGASENLQLMLAGKLNLSTGTQDILLNSAAEGRVLPAIIPCVYLRGILHRTSVLPDSAIKSYADLKGKKIGVPTLSYGGIGFMKFALRHAGVSPDEVQFVAVGDGQQAAIALSSGRIDALTNADVDVAQLQRLGVKLRILGVPDSIKDAATAYAYVFPTAWYDTHKDTAKEIVKGLIRSVIVMTENPEAAVKVSYYMHPEAVPAGVSREKAIQDAVEVIKVRIPLIERKSTVSDKWCEFPQSAWENLVDILGIKGKVDPMKFYTNELIESVNQIREPELREWARSLKVPDGDTEIAAWLKTLKPPL